MSNATPALVFVLMLIAPCAIALIGDRRKAKEAVPGGTKPAEPDAKSKAQPATSPAPMKNPPHSVPVLTSSPAMEKASPAEIKRLQPSVERPSPYERAARFYAPSENSIKPSLQEKGNAVPPPGPVSHDTEQAEAAALLAQVAAAKARAAALAEAARAAQAKAKQAAEIARQTARAAEEAHRAAEYERDIQAQITAQEQARIASGEHLLPESHPSLDFPRSGRGRRAAA